MGNAIPFPKLSPAQAIAAKYARDFFVVFLKHPTGAFMPETSIQSATMDQLVDDILETQLEMPTVIECIIHFNPASGIARLCDQEIADAVAQRSHEKRETPHQSVIDWLEGYKCDFYESDEYLRQCAENELLTLADFRHDMRVQASGAW